MSSTSNSRPARKKADKGSLLGYDHGQNFLFGQEVGEVVGKFADSASQVNKTAQQAIVSNTQIAQTTIEAEEKNRENAWRRLDNDNISENERMECYKIIEVSGRTIERVNDKSRESNEKTVNGQCLFQWLVISSVLVVGVISSTYGMRSIISCHR